MPCNFVMQLSTLRKLSMESVENTNSFDSFKEYLHVVRPVEDDLRTLLHRINTTQKKCLVLLCGSAGDGKSHLISYLHNSDSEHLLDDFELYNDATESSAPSLTSIDTLFEKLTPFDDQHYDTDDGCKMILAINLGTLNNFIESEKGQEYTRLKEYVTENDIFSNYIRKNTYTPNSVFQHISFADYQVFSLCQDEIGTAYLSELIGKIFAKDSRNPFYASYCSNSNCTLCQRCPVRHNFEFMSVPEHQQMLIQKIIETVIKDKFIVSTREIQNLIFDILVHPNFQPSEMSGFNTDIEFIEKYIQYTTPMLLYDLPDLSPLINTMHKHDTLRSRQESMDQFATHFHSLENIAEVFENSTANTPYAVLDTLTAISDLGGKKPEIKNLIYRFTVRLEELKGNYTKAKEQTLFDEYLRYLYAQGSGNIKGLKPLYEMTKRAVMHWDGQFEDDYICIDDSNDKFWILEQLSIKSSPHFAHDFTDQELFQFSPTLTLYFKKNGGHEDEEASISIDYSLFEMIDAMKNGYRPTVQDKNQHTDFVSFVRNLADFGNKSTRIILIPKNSDHPCKIIFEKNEFEYEFKVSKS